MKQTASTILRVAALVVISACAESTSVATGVEAIHVIDERFESRPGQEVAAGIASAMGDASIRVSVLQAFRASDWVEHKLVLQDFVTTPAGKALVALAARSRGVTAAEFSALINSLPLLDFYVPSREERLSWTGNNNVSVALSLAMNAVPASAYTSDGTTIPYSSSHEAGRVLVLLHPAEAKGRRMKRQAASEGATIQDTDDGDIGVQYIQSLGNGDSVVYDLQRTATGKWVVMKADGSHGRELAIEVRNRAAGTRGVESSPAPCENTEESCEGGGGNGGGYGSPPSTNGVRIQARGVCDMDCNAGNEFEFRAKA